MSTNSRIIVKHSDGLYRSVYCHWDGYPSHNGDILLKHYTTQEKCEALVEPGDMSALAEDCSKPEGHSYTTPVKGHCIYYGRDRGDDRCSAMTRTSVKTAWPRMDTCIRYVYVWEDGAWRCGKLDGGPENLIPLADALQTGDE